MVKRTFTPFEEKIWLATPTMHGEELQYVTEAYETRAMKKIFIISTSADFFFDA